MAKKMNFKSLLINHGEKFVVGVVVLLAFLALSSASWSTTSHTPQEVEQIAKETEQKMNQGDWPEDEKVAFDDTPPVDQMVAGIYGGAADSQKFENAVSWNPPLIPRMEKRSSPVVVPPVDPEISVVSFALALPPEEEDTEAAEGSGLVADASKPEEPDTESEEQSAIDRLKERYKQRGGPGAGAGPGALAGLEGGGGETPYGSSPYGPGGYPGGAGMSSGLGANLAGAEGGGGTPYGSSPYGPGGYPGGMEGGYEGGMPYGMMGAGMMYGAATANKRVRLTVGTSVRMVIDLRKQRKAISDALHLSGGKQATQQYVDYIDLHIERMERQDGPEPWGGEWVPVSSDDIGEILEESRMMGVDQDIVSPAVTRRTITMPLPRRGAGVWSPEEASHHQLENFELSAEEKELINQMNAIIAQKAVEAKAMLPPERVQKRGFSSFVTDVGDLQQGMMSSAMYQGEAEFSSGLYGQLESQMSSQLGSDYRLTDKQKKLLDESRATAADRLLLVRFMDFTVERGKAYKYRVRLEMRNPNYNIPIDQLEQPELGSQQTIMSDWSEETRSVYIPMDYRYYVAEVDSRPGDPERVTFPVYMEKTDAGMPVMGDIKVNVGMPIGGSQKLEYVDLATNKLENNDVTFRTRDLLCAASEAGRFSASDHPDLAAELGRLPRGQAAMRDQVVVVDDKGNLQMRTTGDQAELEQRDRLEQKTILEIYESWRPRANTTGSAFPGFGGYEEEAGGAGYGYQMGMGAGSALSGGYGYGGMYGGGTPDGKKMSSRERARQKRRQGGTPGAGGAGGRGGYE